jgi:hypothetical protein
MAIVGDGHSLIRASVATPCDFDLLPAVWHAEADPRTAVDCFSLESQTLDLLDKDQIVRPQGKHPRLNFENSRLRTWRKSGHTFYLALGRAVWRVLTRFVGSGLLRKPLGFRVARLKRKPKVSCPPPSLPETTLEGYSGLILNQFPPWGSEVTALGAKEGASLASSAFVGGSSRSEPTSAADTGTVTGTESMFGGESSCSQVFPGFSCRTQASDLLGFPPSLATNLGFPADPATYPSRVRSDSVLMRSDFEDYQVGKHGVSSGSAGLAESGRTSVGSVECGSPSDSLLCRQWCIRMPLPE